MRLFFATAMVVFANIQMLGAISLPAFSPIASNVEGADFEGTVGLSNCSGSVVRFEKSEDTDNALMMTNGHCVKLMGAGEVFSNQKSSRTMSLLNTKAESQGTLKATQLVYATMSKTDLAFYELEKTYKEIKDAYNIMPLTLANAPARIGDEIRVLSGYWKASFLCKVDDFAYRVKEDRWTWEDSIRYSPECQVYGGTSGSPVILEGTRTVIGVNNTSNESGESCTMNNPCEVTKDNEVSVRKGIGYAQEIYWVYSCLNEKRKIDLSVEGCLLPKPQSQPKH